MGKRNKRYENDARYGRCEVCDADIPLEYFIERGDVIGCSECGAEYFIQALQPVRLRLLKEEQDSRKIHDGR